MRKYTTVTYDHRTPQCKVICALPPPPEASPEPWENDSNEAWTTDGDEPWTTL